MADHQISKLIAQLKNDEAYIRSDAIKKIIKENISDGQIVTALKDVIENDPSMAIRDFAHSALDTINKGHSTLKKTEPVALVFSVPKVNLTPADSLEQDSDMSSQPLPKEAIGALQPVTNDPNSGVVDAARRAIELHSQEENPLPQEVQNTTSNGSPSSMQGSELENQIRELESHKKLLEKSVYESTTIVAAIGIFLVICSCISVIAVVIAGVADFSLLLGNDPETGNQIIVVVAIIAAFLTIPAVHYQENESKRKDKEELERMNIEIQNLKDKIQSMK